MQIDAKLVKNLRYVLKEFSRKKMCKSEAESVLSNVLKIWKISA